MKEGARKRPAEVSSRYSTAATITGSTQWGSTIGLPQRVIDCATALAGKAVEYRQLYDSRGEASAAPPRPKFRELWRTGKSLLEIKALGGEGKQIVSLVAGTLVFANPAFAIVLAGAAGTTVGLVGIAAIIGLAFVL